MRRKIYLNNVPNVTLYANEGGTNTNNCATGCSGCNQGGDSSGPAVAIISAGVTAGAVVIAAALATPEESI